MIPRSLETTEEALRRLGVSSLTLQELIQTIISCSPSTAQLIVEQYKEIREINVSILEQFKTSDGSILGFTRAARLASAIELANRTTQRIANQKVIGASSLAKHFAYLSNAPDEHIIIIGINLRNCIECEIEISNGTRDWAIFDVGHLFRKLHQYDAVRKFVLIHNHPEGDHRPSLKDDETTKVIKELGAKIGLTLVDHVIVSSNGFYSYVGNKKL